MALTLQLLLLAVLHVLATASALTTGGHGPAAPRSLPELPTLWSPGELAAFLHHEGQHCATAGATAPALACNLLFTAARASPLALALAL